jgi:hypothetical protein
MRSGGSSCRWKITGLHVFTEMFLEFVATSNLLDRCYHVAFCAGKQVQNCMLLKVFLYAVWWPACWCVDACAVGRSCCGNKWWLSHRALKPKRPPLGSIWKLISTWYFKQLSATLMLLQFFNVHNIGWIKHIQRQSTFALFTTLLHYADVQACLVYLSLHRFSPFSLPTWMSIVPYLHTQCLGALRRGEQDGEWQLLLVCLMAFGICTPVMTLLAHQVSQILRCA